MFAGLSDKIFIIGEIVRSSLPSAGISEKNVDVSFTFENVLVSLPVLPNENKKSKTNFLKLAGDIGHFLC